MPTEIRRKNWDLLSLLSRPLKVVGTDTDRSVPMSYDFLLVIRNNLQPISYTASKIYQYISPIPVYLTPSLRRFLLDCVTSEGIRKLE